MLSAITDGSLDNSPMILSAGGHDEHPWDVNSSTTARGSAWAGRMIATMAQTPSVPDHREIKLWVIIVATLEPGYDALTFQASDGIKDSAGIGDLFAIEGPPSNA